MKIIRMVFFPLLMTALLMAAFALPKCAQIAKDTNEIGIVDDGEVDSGAVALASQIKLSPLEILDEIEKEQPTKLFQKTSQNGITGSGKVLSFFSSVQVGNFDEAESILSGLKNEIDGDTMETLTGNLAAAREKEGVIAELKIENQKIQKTMSENLMAEASALRQELSAIKEAVPTMVATEGAAVAAPVKESSKKGRAETVSIAFGFDSSFLSDAGKELLAPTVAAMTADGQIKAQLRGFADATGSSEYNAVVAMARCESVRDFLIESGIDEGRLSVMSFGETQASDPVDKPKRRVDVRLR